jgi:hypothetical protein
MPPIDYNSVKSEMEMFMTDLHDSNYYNPRLSVVRIASPVADGQFYDYRLSATWFPPNPKAHRILLIAAREQMSDFGLSEERLELVPGLEKDGTPAEIPMGTAFIIDRNQRLNTVDNQTGSTAFSISNTKANEDNVIRVALTPPLMKDYTNNDSEDQDENQVGLWITDNVVFLRSRGAQVTLGDEGIHIGGKQFWENTAHSKEIMQDNFIHQLVPSTIPTAAISIPQLPNFGMIAQIANAANKVINILNITGGVFEAIQNANDIF